MTSDRECSKTLSASSKKNFPLNLWPAKNSGNQYLSSGHILSKGISETSNHCGFISSLLAGSPLKSSALKICTSKISGFPSQENSRVPNCSKFSTTIPASSSSSLLAASS